MRSSDELASSDCLLNQAEKNYLEIIRAANKLANCLPTELWAEVVPVLAKIPDIDEDDLANLKAYLVPESKFHA